MSRAKPGSESVTPGVSAHPGCIDETVMSSPASSRAQSGASTSCILFVRAYAAVPE